MTLAHACICATPMVDDDPVLASIERSYRSNYQRFLHVAAAITGNTDLAADAVQEAFLRAIRRRRSYRGRGVVEAWLWRIVVNAARDAAARRQDFSIDELPELGARPGSGRDVTELRAAVSALPERQRLVLFLRYFADLDYQTIAHALEINHGTVGATLHSAHNALRTQIEEVESR
jgi:RNA polymerase sigma-70 factor, ECF subfamily